MTQVKFCGVTTPHDALLAQSLGVLAVGVNFVPSSVRFVAPARAREILRVLGPQVWRVGVFRDHNAEAIMQISNEAGLDTVQFHGRESTDFCARFSALRRIKALKLSEARLAKDYLDVADFLLIDSGAGGEGRSGPLEEIMSIVSPEVIRRKVIIAGGLTSENVAAKISLVRPFAVDVASGIEEVPGRKNEARMRAFVEAVKGVDHALE